MSSQTHAYAFTSTSPPAVALAPPAQPGSCNVLVNGGPALTVDLARHRRPDRST